jgi:hypothetical protein
MSENISKAGQDNAWKNAARTWLLIKVMRGFNKNQVAKAIFDSHEHLIPRNGITSKFVTRADVVSGEYDIVVALNGENKQELEDLIASVMNIDGVNREMSVEARVERHYPNPPHKARGYITKDEENPNPPGITGSNAWG